VRRLRPENPSYGPGNADYEYDAHRQRLDEAATDRLEAEAKAKRQASGTSVELLSIQDAFAEGGRAGARSLSASLNPFQHPSPEHDAWERGRFGALTVRAARMVA
jgi:hypothetical protein